MARTNTGADPYCFRCAGKGLIWLGQGYAKCPCTKPGGWDRRFQAGNAYRECSRKWKEGTTEFENIALALRGALEHYSIEELVKMGSLTRVEIQEIRTGQMRLG